jgi:3-methyladenine DNA glycosylase/8-oxoguanine DNA glycosylase
MSFEISVPQPFNFEATIKTHGWFQLPPFYWDGDEKILTWGLRVKDDLSLVRIKTVEETSTFSRIRFDGRFEKSAAKIIKSKFRYIFNLDLDLSEFYRLCRRDPLLRQVPKRGIGRLMRAETLWEDLFKSICGTNVQWKQAVKMIHQIATAGEAIASTHYFLFPTPHAILNAGESFLKDVGRVGYRSSYLIELAKRFADGDMTSALVERGELSLAEMKKYFLGFKGIGKATTHYLLALHGHFAEMAVDSLVIKYMKERHFAGQTPTEKQIIDYYDRFGRWRYLAYWMEFIINEGWSPDAG